MIETAIPFLSFSKFRNRIKRIIFSEDFMFGWNPVMSMFSLMLFHVLKNDKGEISRSFHKKFIPEHLARSNCNYKCKPGPKLTVYKVIDMYFG